MNRHPCKPGRAPLLLALALAWGTAAASPPLPAWQSLEFEEQALWVSARSKITLHGATEADDEETWEMQSVSSVASNSEETRLRFRADDGGLRTRHRLSRGREERFKSWTYLPDYILRERRSPTRKQRQPELWELTSRRELSYPAADGKTGVTHTHVLLLLAARVARGDGEPLEVTVNTDLNFYRVLLTPGEPERLQVSYRNRATGELVAESTLARPVHLRARPAGELRDKPDFELFGLSGEVDILIDADSGLPLQLRGEAPMVGRAEVNLRSVVPRVPG